MRSVKIDESESALLIWQVYRLNYLPDRSLYLKYFVTVPGPPRPAPASSASSGRRSAGAVGQRWEGASGSVAAESVGDGSAAPETGKQY